MYTKGNIIYAVNIEVLVPYAQEWVEWMKDVHIPDVINTGLLEAIYIAKRSADENKPDYVGFEICYVAVNIENLKDYQARFAPKLQEEHTQRYAGKFIASRKIAEVL